MDFDPNQHLAIAKEVIELIDSTEDLVKMLSRGTTKFENDSLIVYKEDKHISFYHNKSFYVTAFVHNIGLSRGLMGSRSFLKHNATINLEAIVIPQDE